MKLTSRDEQGHLLLQVGVFLFLAALLVGLVIPAFAVPRLGLSTHLLGMMQGLFLMALGLLWPRLRLGSGAARLGVVLAVYGCLAAWTANLLAALWGAGNTLPIAAGAARGSALQENVIVIALRTGGAALIAATALVLWGLRLGPKGGSRE
jgi:hydroxylaminobenzene mutase